MKTKQQHQGNKIIQKYFRKGDEPPAAVAEKGWRFHHLGIPDTEIKSGEKYIPKYK